MEFSSKTNCGCIWVVLSFPNDCFSARLFYNKFESWVDHTFFQMREISFIATKGAPGIGNVHRKNICFP